MKGVATVGQSRVLAGLAANPPAVFLPDEKTGERFVGFFTANHQNKHKRRDETFSSVVGSATVVPCECASGIGTPSRLVVR
jgi:hypothetical protein